MSTNTQRMELAEARTRFGRRPILRTVLPMDEMDMFGFSQDRSNE